MTNETSIKVLPAEGLISLHDLCEFLHLKKIERLKEKLNRAGVKTINLSRNSHYRFVNIADLIKSNLMFNSYKKKGDLVKADLKDSPVPNKEEQKDTLQGVKERIVFVTDNPADNERFKGELLSPDDCFGRLFGKDECCQRCDVIAEFDGTKGPLKLFCEAMSLQPVEIKAA